MYYEALRFILGFYDLFFFVFKKNVSDELTFIRLICVVGFCFFVERFEESFGLDLVKFLLVFFSAHDFLLSWKYCSLRGL